MTFQSLALTANENPTIPFERSFGYCPSESNLMEPPVPDNCTGGLYNRLLGKTKHEIKPKIKEPQDTHDHLTDTIKLKKHFSLMIYDYISEDVGLPDKNRAIYLLEHNNSIGYCLLDYIHFKRGDDDNFENEPVILQIKALPINPTYLQNELTIPAGATLRFYEAPHDTLIERYAILTTPSGQDSGIMLDAFYPKELEETFKPYIIEALNINMASFVQYSAFLEH